LANIEKAIVTILSHPAMAEVTALAGFAVSIVQARKPNAQHRILKKSSLLGLGKEPT
jgi:hypothetical protein